MKKADTRQNMIELMGIHGLEIREKLIVARKDAALALHKAGLHSGLQGYLKPALSFVQTAC